MKGYEAAYYTRDHIQETWFWRNGLLRPDQLAALCYLHGRPFRGNEGDEARDPGLIYSIGAGRGELEAVLERLGCTVVGVDPSPGAKFMYEASTLADRYDGGGDSVLFCESIEHIPADELFRIWELIPAHARIVVVNWESFHPIEPDGSGWDHVTLVDDTLYDDLSQGRRVVVRRGSHLVLDPA